VWSNLQIQRFAKWSGRWEHQSPTQRSLEKQQWEARARSFYTDYEVEEIDDSEDIADRMIE
jgi:hypothetical protein